MSFTKPVLYYQNALRDAQTGDDGTSYANCSKAFSYINDPNKILGVITKMADITFLSNTNGLQCVFDTTRNKYRIVALPTYSSLPISANWKAIAHNGTLFCAIAYGSAIAATSIDGIIWTQRALPVSANWQAIAWNGTVFCAIAYGSSIAATSTDGVIWTQQTLPTSANWTCITAGGSLFCAVVGGVSTIAATSSNGSSWTQQVIIQANWVDIAWNGSVFCVIAGVGSSNITATSPTGATGSWTQYTLPSVTTWKAIAWNGSVFCAIASGGTIAATSSTGASWSAKTLPSSTTWQDIAWNGTVFCAIATGGAIAATSVDGTTWYSSTLPSSSAWQAIAWSGQAFCAIVYNSVNAAVSQDGTIWPQDILTIFERLQTADIGTSFKVRAGLTCAEAAATKPVMYAADGHLSPRMKGTVNTALYLRAHAPNFIEDGGFESGVFSPNWTAGANWAIDSTNELEGYYSAKWDTAANNNLVQSRTNKLIKGKTYRVIVKTKALTGNASANCLTITPKQAGSGTSIYAAISGNAIAPTTTSTWTEFDIVPDFTTDNWEFWIVPLLANKGSATAIIVDEIYLYEKKTINTLIVGKHNWGGHGALVVKAWRVSPLRSTAASDANNYTEIASFTPDTSDTIIQALTSSVYPIVELALPAAAAWTPEMGDISVGDYWQVPVFPKPMDPYKTNKDRLRELSLDLQRIAPALRLTNIADLYDKIRADEAMWVQWNGEIPFLVESADNVCDAPYDPYAVKLQLKLIERL